MTEKIESSLKLGVRPSRSTRRSNFSGSRPKSVAVSRLVGDSSFSNRYEYSKRRKIIKIHFGLVLYNDPKN